MHGRCFNGETMRGSGEFTALNLPYEHLSEGEYSLPYEITATGMEEEMLLANLHSNLNVSYTKPIRGDETRLMHLD